MPGSDSELHFLTISEASKLIETRKLSPVELAEALLRRVDALEPRLNAFITRTADRAIDDARKAEDAVMSGSYRGPLHGIPYGLKDIYCTRNILTTGHSKVCADYVPDFDATTVRKLNEAGGLLFGKLATHEFAHGGPSFDLPWPPARNPWDRGRATGGSSSGAGAAVAAGFLMGAMGSDTGGSIRNPAALCGLVGLKPTYGLVSRYGVYANSFTFDHAGPLTWSVEDCAIMMQALAGHDPLDPASADRPTPDYRAALAGGVKGLKIGVIRHFYEEDLPVSPALRDALEAAYGVLRSLGAELEDVRIRPAQDYYDVKIVAAESELYAVHEANLRKRAGDFGEDFLGRSLPAIFVRGSDYTQALRERRKMIAEMAPLYEKYDLFVTAGPGPAPRLDAWRTIQFWKSASLTTPFNVTGGPALVQCIGYTEDGLPLSMQVVGKPFDDALVMRAAHAYEKATPWRDRRPVLDPNADFSAALPPVPDPAPDELSAKERDDVAAACRRAGLELDARAFQQLCATAPYIQAMVERLRRDRPFTEEPMNTHRFPG